MAYSSIRSWAFAQAPLCLEETFSLPASTLPHLLQEAFPDAPWLGEGSLQVLTFQYNLHFPGPGSSVSTSVSPATEAAHRTGPGPTHLVGPSPILPSTGPGAEQRLRKHWMKEGRNAPDRILKLVPPLLALARAPKNITQRPRAVVWRMQKNHSARPGNQTSQNLTSLNHTLKLCP